MAQKEPAPGFDARKLQDYEAGRSCFETNCRPELESGYGP